MTDAALRLNFVAHAARAYFDNGGSRLYVMRTYAAGAATNGGVASATLLNGAGDATTDVTVSARAPGAVFRGRLLARTTVRSATVLTLGTAPQGSLLSIVVGNTETLYVKSGTAWNDSAATALSLANLGPTDTPGGNGAVASLVQLSVEFQDADGYAQGWDELGFAATHPRFIGTVLSATPANRCR